MKLRCALMDLLNGSQWCNASRKLTGQKMPEEKVERILASFAFALQIYTVIAATSDGLKQH